MAAAGGGEQIAGDIFHGYVAAVGGKVSGAGDVTGDDVAAGGGKGEAAVDVVGLHVSAAGPDVERVIFGRVDFDGDPEAASQLAAECAAAKRDALGSIVGVSGEIFQELFGVFLGGVGFEVDVIVHVA